MKVSPKVDVLGRNGFLYRRHEGKARRLLEVSCATPIFHRGSVTKLQLPQIEEPTEKALGPEYQFLDGKASANAAMATESFREFGNTWSFRDIHEDDWDLYNTPLLECRYGIAGISAGH